MYIQYVSIYRHSQAYGPVIEADLNILKYNLSTSFFVS